MLNSEKFFVHHIIETHHLQSDSPRLAPRPILCLTLSHGCSRIESTKDDISKPPPVVEDGNEKAECNVRLERIRTGSQHDSVVIGGDFVFNTTKLKKMYVFQRLWSVELCL